MRGKIAKQIRKKAVQISPEGTVKEMIRGTVVNKGTRATYQYLKKEYKRMKSQ